MLGEGEGIFYIFFYIEFNISYNNLILLEKRARGVFSDTCILGLKKGKGWNSLKAVLMDETLFVAVREGILFRGNALTPKKLVEVESLCY